MKDPHLISVDELRAAGALDVPAAWRKSLGAKVERDLFSDLGDDDENVHAAGVKRESSSGDVDGEEAAD